MIHNRTYFCSLSPLFINDCSRAIMSYLADQYSKNIHLNPQTPSGRALINHRLHFDIDTLYRGMKNYYVSIQNE